MKNDHVLKFINKIGPNRIEKVDILLPGKRRLPKLARTGLIAACLCLSLLCTAFAANSESVVQLIDRLTIRVSSEEKDPSYSAIGGAMTKYPLSAFSPTLNAASEARENPAAPVSLTFDTWDEVQAFLGPDIPCVWPDSWDADWIQVLLFHTESEVLWGIDIFSVDLSRQAEIRAEIRTELWQGVNARSDMSSPDGCSITQLTSYPMINGGTAELIQVTYPETTYADGTPSGTGPQWCTSYFMQDGILYEVSAFSPVPPQETTEAQLKTILDDFS